MAAQALKGQTMIKTKANEAKSFSTRSNAQRAVRSFLAKVGGPLVGVKLEVEPVGDAFQVYASGTKGGVAGSLDALLKAGFVVGAALGAGAPLAPGSEAPAAKPAKTAVVKAAGKPLPVHELPPQGLCGTKPEAIAKAREAYGAEARIGDDVQVKKTVRGEWYWGPAEPKPAPRAPKAAKTAKEPRAPRAKADRKPGQPSKGEQMIAMLKRAKGATVAEIAEAFDWQPHTTRARISVDCRKLGLKIEKSKSDTRGTVYKVAA